MARNTLNPLLEAAKEYGAGKASADNIFLQAEKAELGYNASVEEMTRSLEAANAKIAALQTQISGTAWNQTLLSTLDRLKMFQPFFDNTTSDNPALYGQIYIALAGIVANDVKYRATCGIFAEKAAWGNWFCVTELQNGRLQACQGGCGHDLQVYVDSDKDTQQACIPCRVRFVPTSED